MGELPTHQKLEVVSVHRAERTCESCKKSCDTVRARSARNHGSSVVPAPASWFAVVQVWLWPELSFLYFPAQLPMNLQSSTPKVPANANRSPEYSQHGGLIVHEEK